MPNTIKALLWATLAVVVSADMHYAFNHPINNWSVNTTISFPGQSDFTNATIRWNAYEGPGYAAAVTVGSAEDVAKTVCWKGKDLDVWLTLRTDKCKIRIARALNASLLATGGRHSSSTTLNDVEYGIAIDLQRLNTVKVDAENAILTVGGGTRFGHIVDPVYEAGFEMGKSQIWRTI